MKTLQPEPVWWCWLDGAEATGTERPRCPRNSEHVLVSLGWRVGYNSATYSWYSTAEHALTDKRCKQ